MNPTSVFHLLFFCSLFLRFELPINAQVNSDSQRIFLQIEHNFEDDNNNWRPKGTLSFKNPQSFLLSDLSKIQNSVRFQHIPLSSEEKINLQKAIDNNSFYKIRLATGNPRLPYVTSAVKACTLLASDFEERIVVHLDNGYNIIGIDYQPRNGICHKNIKQIGKKNIEFTSNAELQFATEGPKPLVEEVKQQIQDQEKKNEPGFFTKYWYYIVPIVLISLTSALISVPPNERNAESTTTTVPSSHTNNNAGKKKS